MASETDRITKTNLLKGVVKLEDFDATLANIDAEHDDYSAVLRRARALSKALLATGYELVEVGVAIGRGGQHRQMTIDDLLSAVRKELGGTSPDGEDAVREVVETDVPPPKPARKKATKPKPAKLDLQPPAEDPEPADDAESAAAVGEFFATPDAVAAAVAEKGRTIPASAIAAWDDDERLAVMTWAKGDAGEEPEVLGRLYVEELDLTSTEDATRLLRSLGVPMPGTDEVDDQTYEALLVWAEHAHRFDRGDEGVDVPPIPDSFLPETEIFAAIHGHVEGVGEIARPDLVAHFQQQDFGAAFAVEAMVRAGDLEEDDVGLIRVGTGDSAGEATDEDLEYAAALYANRKAEAAEPESAAEDTSEGGDQATVGDADEAATAGADPELSIEEQQAFGAGFKAREEGGAETDNPHDPEHAEAEHLAWSDGFRKASEVLEAPPADDEPPAEG